MLAAPGSVRAQLAFEPLALLSHMPERRAEGLSLIEATAALEPRTDHVVEDLAIRIDARERLESELRAH